MKVAIVGGAPATEMLAPFDNHEWEIWVHGNRAQKYKRITRIFEVHEDMTEHGSVDAYVKFLCDLGLPLVVSDKFPKRNANIDVFSYEESEKLYGSVYLTSSPAYMMSYALARGATDIAIYGVDLSVDDHEYFWQRPCLEAWIGFARGRGVNVIIPDAAHIGKSSYAEGRDWRGRKPADGLFSETDFNAMASVHASSLDQIRDEQHELQLQYAAHDGARQVYAKLAKVARAKAAKVDVKSIYESTLIIKP